MSNNWKFGLILVTVFLGFFLRIYKVDQIPPSLSWDEVSIGYNAYSVLKTGYDEHYKFLPLDAFAAYGDYKPPLPIYLTIPSVALFGLNEFAVRLPSVVAGSASIAILYLLVLELFSNYTAEESPGEDVKPYWIAFVSSLLFAISPWHIQLSRAGFEANIALFFIILGIWIVYLTRRNRKLLYICWLPFIAAIYTFNSARYFSPILIVGLLGFLHKTLFKDFSKLMTGLLVAGLFLLPILPHLISKESRLRYAEVNIFSDSGIVLKANERIREDNNAWWANIVHNRRVGYFQSYFIHFFDNLEPSFLFIKGDGNPKLSIQDVGELYFVEIPFLLLGIYFIVKYRPRLFLFIIFWLVFAIVPAATARETPHALRIENSLPAFIILIATGIVLILKQLKNNKWLLFVLIGLYTFSLGYYFHNYYIHYSNEYSGEWQYGYKEAIKFIQPIKNSYNTIVLTENIGRAYMYTLFYERYDPSLIEKTIDGGFDAAGFYNVRGLGKYNFTKESVNSRYQRKVLYILSPQNVPSQARIIHTVKLLNGNPILVIFEV